MIKFENVSFAYPDSENILNEINLEISQGEQVAIVGCNGSGKTTLSLLINGVLKARSGRITVNGLDPSDIEDAIQLKRKVGLVFQNPDNQLVSTTIESEVAFSLENANVDYETMHHRVNTILEYFNLSDNKTGLTSALSGGEKQKLALVSVLVTEPDILILDEPGSYLDESGKCLLDSAIEKMTANKPDMTVIRITQYGSIAQRYPRIIVCNNGSIIADGPAEQIFRMDPTQIGISVPIPYQLLNDQDRNFKNESESTETITPTISEKSIKAESISFGYPSIQKISIFDNQSIEIESGKVYGLVGKSGTGKTTLLQLLSGLLKPDNGHIERVGFDTTDLVSVVFQQPERQFFKETVDEEIRFGPENIKLTDTNLIVNNAYLKVGLDKEKYAHRNSFNLSGGEKRRLAFASIISLNPAFIFFDEPTCALDSDGIDKFISMIQSLKSAGHGIIIVSHFGDIIFELADEIIMIEEGVIHQSQPKRQFFLNCHYQNFLSVPEAVAYQTEKFGELRYLTKSELLTSVE